jgi:hypothetical protein
MKLSVVKKLVQPIAISAFVVGINLLAVTHAQAAGFNMGMSEGANAAKGVDQVSNLFGAEGTFRTITNVLLFLIGAISVIMLIIGGLRYVVSGGDSTAVQNAKNTILYAIVGVIVSILAYAAVSFVISSFSGTGGTGATNV